MKLTYQIQHQINTASFVDQLDNDELTGLTEAILIRLHSQLGEMKQLYLDDSDDLKNLEQARVFLNGAKNEILRILNDYVH